MVETSSLQEVLRELDVIYIVMLQHHRIHDPHIVERLRQDYYRITPELLSIRPKRCDDPASPGSEG